MVLSDFDQNLLSRCLAGDEHAWEEFVDRFLPLITHAVNITAQTRMIHVPPCGPGNPINDVLHSEKSSGPDQAAPAFDVTAQQAGGATPGRMASEVVPSNRIGSRWRDDAVAEVFLGLVQDDFAVLRRFRGQSSLGTYLVVIARRIAARKFSQWKREAAAAGDLADVSASGFSEKVAVPQRNGNDDPQWRLDNSDQVESLLKRMPDTEATAIRMFHMEHRSYQEIGQRIGIPENSVGPLLSKARQRMRRFESEA